MNSTTWDAGLLKHDLAFGTDASNLQAVFGGSRGCVEGQIFVGCDACSIRIRFDVQAGRQV